MSYPLVWRVAFGLITSTEITKATEAAAPLISGQEVPTAPICCFCAVSLSFQYKLKENTHREFLTDIRQIDRLIRYSDG